MAGPKPRSRWLVRGAAFAILVGLVFVLGSLNVPQLEADEPSEVILLYLFSTLVFLAFVIYGLILIRYLARLYAEHRRQELGARFKSKMVVGALALSLLPVLALFFLSYALVNRTLAKWFPRPLEIVRDDALFIVQHLLRERETLARELASLLAENPELRRQLEGRDLGALQETVARLAERHELEWVAVVDPSDQPIAVYRRPGSRADFLSRIPVLLEPRAAVAYTTSETLGESEFSLARVRVESEGAGPLGALVVAQTLPESLLARIAQIESESRAYDSITQGRKLYRWQALLILLLLTILLLLAATWSALYLAKQVTVPIQSLALATKEVSRGHFDHRVDCPAQDELGILVASFNQMTAQLGENRRQLDGMLRELEERRQWMETILESVPTGVLTLSPELRIRSSNPAAQALLPLSEPAGSADWLSLLEAPAASSLRELFSRAAQAGFASGQLDVRVRDRIAHLAVAVSALGPAPHQGYVLVLDDLTDLLKAQKAAAWQEVAQRIAHEIKNPLTPIQLSADRIRRYLERQGEAPPAEQTSYRERIAQCARLISEEVHALKALVDEFSRFARFPVVQPVPTPINQVVESTLPLYQQAGNDVELTAELASDLPLIPADPELLRRALVNLIDNATEAVAQAPRKQVRVGTRYLAGQNAVELTVSDTGPGIPREHKDRLFLPFFSTKENGMGLGLAIVSRIVAEHQGRIRAEDNLPSGARFVVELPTQARPAPAQAGR